MRMPDIAGKAVRAPTNAQATTIAVNATLESLIKTQVTRIHFGPLAEADSHVRLLDSCRVHQFTFLRRWSRQEVIEMTLENVTWAVFATRTAELLRKLAKIENWRRERDSVSRQAFRFTNIQRFDCHVCHISRGCRAALHRLHRLHRRPPSPANRDPTRRTCLCARGDARARPRAFRMISRRRGWQTARIVEFCNSPCTGWRLNQCPGY
jgi:hypothetical protein